ncbi:hypothetical protein DM02DRAFT_610837 [Periconia macrospinosa]|uniref:Uncharacterized protein n=1 Tax=Periconia macrospinosa TaxID=97972 RepID=A0A2V1E7P0_9PLEO|nr:hypothetical protein DM02DRAFT_610837 [Periconia macrospinosa]
MRDLLAGSFARTGGDSVQISGNESKQSRTGCRTTWVIIASIAIEALTSHPELGVPGFGSLVRESCRSSALPQIRQRRFADDTR